MDQSVQSDLATALTSVKLQARTIARTVDKATQFLGSMTIGQVEDEGVSEEQIAKLLEDVGSSTWRRLAGNSSHLRQSLSTVSGLFREIEEALQLAELQEAAKVTEAEDSVD